MHTGPSIQTNGTHVKGVESAYRVPQYRVMLLMLEVSKVHGSSQYRVMLLMSKVSKEAQNGLRHLCSQLS